MGCDNLQMKNGAVVLKHVMSRGFMGRVVASANGCNNLAVTFRE